MQNKQEENQIQVQKSPNLIDEDTKVYSPQKLQALSLTTRVNIYLLLIVELIVILLILINLKLSNDVTKLDFKLMSQERQLREVADVEAKAVELQNGVTLLNQIRAFNPKISEKLKLVYDFTPGEVVVNSLNLEGNTLSLNLTATRGTDLAKFVISYLGTKRVSQINLNGARLDPQFNSYTFDVEVILL